MISFEQRKIQEISLFDALQAKRNGTIKLPIYQRDAVWGEGRICALWDSLLRRFPLPSFLLIKGKGKSKNFQTHHLSAHGHSTDEQDNYYDLLDGQQRMAAIDTIEWPETKEDQDLHPVRLWLDLAPGEEPHPLKFKYWIHACTKVFPFGFKMRASGEHDFAVLDDSELLEIWNRLQCHTGFQGKEFYELSLANARPFKAGCPVPLDGLMNLLHATKHGDDHVKADELIEPIMNLSKTLTDTGVFLEKPRELNPTIVEGVAEAFSRLHQYRLVFQLIDWNADTDEDNILYERIGRGGVQITPRQLAVSKLLSELGREGNDAVASFQESDKLQHLLDTEDVVHALARVAFAAVTDPAPPDKSDTEDSKNSRDLLDLTPQRLKAIQRDTGKWHKFLEKLREYCLVKGENQASHLQQAFEHLYSNLRYAGDNPDGFSFVQLAQPDRLSEGIAPITLHPLLYWYLECSHSEPADQPHRDDMLRWVLFANGFTDQPKHLKLNHDVFQLMVRYGKCDFTQIKEHIQGDETLRKELGLIWSIPVVENEALVYKEHQCSGVPQPDEMIERTARRLILQNWSDSGIRRFILLWNQRDIMESLYGKTHYKPALFSKGRPFDVDHIVARDHFLNRVIKNDLIHVAIKAIAAGSNNFKPIQNLHGDIGVSDRIGLKEVIFRRWFPNSVGNYRYWPRRLNRKNQNQVVGKKLNTGHVRKDTENDPLKSTFGMVDKELLWKWSAMPLEDESLWTQMPPVSPKQWDDISIGEFILAAFKWEHFLYTNAYNFLENKNP